MYGPWWSAAAGSNNIRIGGPNVAGDVLKWTAACMHARANRSGKPGEEAMQSYNNCGPEAVRTAVQELTHEDVDEKTFLHWAVDHSYADWRTRGVPPQKQSPENPDPNWDRTRIDKAYPTDQNKAANFDEAGASQNGDWKRMLDAKNVPSEMLPGSSSDDVGFNGAAEQAIREGNPVLLPIDSGYNGDAQGGNHVIMVSGVEYDDNGQIVALYVNDTSAKGGCGMRVPIEKIRSGVDSITSDKLGRAGTFSPVPVRVGTRQW